MLNSIEMERLCSDVLAYTYISGNGNISLFQVLNCNFDAILVLFGIEVVTFKLQLLGEKKNHNYKTIFNNM